MEKLDDLFKISRIIAKEKTGELTGEEMILLQKWLDENENNKMIYERLKVNMLSSDIEEFNRYNAQKAFKKIKKSISGKRSIRIPSFIPKIYKIAAAVAILVICGYLVYHSISVPSGYQYAARYIKPGTQKAFLTTSGNQKIALGNTKLKAVYTYQNTIITDTNAILTFKTKKAVSEELVAKKYNLLEIPRGGEYSLILTDGTKVMLNSDSKLKFPETFTGNTREVELTGEAYFEVSKMKDKPFIVHTSKLDITVYGTSFNVSSYVDDNILQTTLVEGIVGISIKKGTNMLEYKLTPGLQANYDKASSEVSTIKVNTDLYTAWTKDMFVFEDESIEKILKRLARWYNLEIEYSDDRIKNEFFTGDLNLKKFDNISKILEMLSMASDISFKIDNRKLIVYSGK